MSVRILMTVGVAAILLSGTQASAAVNNTANTLKVSPVRRDVEIKPGETKTVQATVTNLTNEDINIRPVENDFVAGDESGSPALILDENKYAPTHSLKRFMTPLENVTIPAKESKVINVVITVPKTAQAGGYFGAIRFSAASANDGGQVNLDTSVASLILLTVPGKTVETLTMTDFAVKQNGKSNTIFGTPDKLQVSARFLNQGNVQVGPFGKISVKQGDKVVYEADFNNKNPRDVVLPDSARRWDIPLNKIGSFGYYTVNAMFTYGKDNKTIEVTKSFWIISQAVVIGAIVALVALVALAIGIWRYFRGRSRYSPRKSGRFGGFGSRR